MHRIKYGFISGTDETNVGPVEAAIEKGKQVIFNLQIPDTLKGELIDVLVSTVEMIMEWYGDHRYFLRSYFDDLYSFHWTLEGAIDRLKTAQALVQRKDALESIRFKLAAAYCLEADVLRLWTRSFETSVWQFFKGQTSHGHAIWHSYWYKYGHNFRYYSGKIPGHLLNYPDPSLWPIMAKKEQYIFYRILFQNLKRAVF
ncbi:hypothetical protein CEXT_357381 [Caerostris extrusa]|uniref:Uncharacterized protein n=1 Tax=Caerostris extrusa TaxID=172846 RepID=A0AAV4XLA4_CAEEX|nr:hypothetical protein CEXT_357381 [Caerostris extrusa]